MPVHIVLSRLGNTDDRGLHLIKADDVKSVETIIKNRGDEVIKVIPTSISEEGFVAWEDVVGIAKESFRLGHEAFTS